MNNFDDVKSFALANAESDLLQAGHSYESFADLLADDEDDANGELATECWETSRRTLAQLNQELAEIALADALAICHGEGFDDRRLIERGVDGPDNLPGSQTEIIPEEDASSGNPSVSRSHLNVLQAVDAVVQFRHFEVDGLVSLPQDHFP